MEVILKNKLNYIFVRSILHVCGGDPMYPNSFLLNVVYSPRVWRWSYDDSKKSTTNSVFSTCVEVILVLHKDHLQSRRILHVCGGDPNPSMQGDWDLEYSPRVWRWSLQYKKFN